MRNILSLIVKSNSWPSRGGTVSKHQERTKGGYMWHLETSAPCRMNSIALPAVILGEGKSLIFNPGQINYLVEN